MNKFCIISFLICGLFITSYSQGQSKYPYMTVIDGDTVAIALMSQVDSLNIVYASRDEYKERYDSLNSAVDGFRVVIVKNKEAIKELKAKIKLENEIKEQKDIVIDECDKVKEKLKKKNNRLKAANKTLVVVSGVLAVILAVFILL